MSCYYMYYAVKTDNDKVVSLQSETSRAIGVKHGPVRLITPEVTRSQSLIDSQASCNTYNYKHTSRSLHRESYDLRFYLVLPC